MISSIYKDNQYIVIFNPETTEEKRLLSEILRIGNNTKTASTEHIKAEIESNVFAACDDSPFD